MVEHRQLGEGGRGLLGGLLTLDDPRAFYEAGYSKPDAAEAERLGRWRALGARSKAAHVRALCARTKLRPRTIVEIGCGDGALLAALRGLAPVFDGFELSPPAAELARRALPDARRIEAFDGLEVPAEDGAYDLAILSHVLEHVPVPLPLLAEAARVAHEVVVEVPLEDNRSAARPGQARGGRVGSATCTSSRAPTCVSWWPPPGSRCRRSSRTRCPCAHHAFFAGGLRARSAAAAKWAVRAAAHRMAPRTAETLFTVHYAVLARRP